MSTNGRPSRSVLICTYHVVQANLDSSSRRLAYFVDFLLEEGWEVTVAAKNPEDFDRRAHPLRQRGVHVFHMNREEMERVVSAGEFDLAIIAFWNIAEQVVNVIRNLSPQTPIIVDSMDLHFLRGARQRFSQSDGARRALDEDYGREMAREINTYAAADQVLTVSRKEAQLIDDLVGKSSLVHVVPDCEDLDASGVRFEERSGIVIIGNYEHPPNVDAVGYLCTEIVPRLDPDLLAAHPIRIVGNDLNAAVKSFATDVSGVELVGWVPSVTPYLENARVSIVPLRYGAGTKRKIIQSLMLGTPTVSTSVGVEGLPIKADKEILVANDPVEFAKSIEILLRDRETWQRLALAGRDRVLSVHGREASKRRFLRAIGSALSRGPKGHLVPQIDGAPWGLPAAGRDYTSLVRRLHRLVREQVPERSRVVVVSKGDPELVEFDDRNGWHFPRETSGEYSGYYPKTSEEAVAHLEELVLDGAQFFLVPETNLWWLEHYDGLREHLEHRFSTVTWEPELGALFDLTSPKAPPPPLLSTNGHGSTVQASRATPAITVVIPTRDRAELLSESLASLAGQSLSRPEFEVVVVDDGSTDHTKEICRSWEQSLNLRYERIEREGIAVAKNTGAILARAPIVFFFDDDDVADQELLAEHVRAHTEHPDENVAVLGYTTWAPSLEVSEIMHFVTDVGGYLFKYDGLEDGQLLDFSYFWGGRASCKKSILAKRGLFNPAFEFGCEDIELAYRLSDSGFKVVFRRGAVQYMNRAVTYEEFCSRCERQGRAQLAFSRMHRDDVVRGYCGIDDARWEEAEELLTQKQARVADLERELDFEPNVDERVRRELWDLYWWSFDVFKAKGIAEAGAPAQEMPQALRTAYKKLESCRDPVFVVGAPRSGTTALARAISQHPDFWSSEESYILRELFGNSHLEGEFARWSSRPGGSLFRSQDIDFGEFAGFLGLGINGLLSDRSGGKRWIDHTPEHVLLVDSLAQMFPGAKFIHLLRDGRSVVASMLNMGRTMSSEVRAAMIEGEYLPDWQFDFSEACRMWAKSAEAGRAACLEHPERCLEVSYEALTTAPDAQFDGIFDFLEADRRSWSATYWKSNVYNSSFQPDGPPSETSHLGPLARWEQWTPEQRSIFSREAGEVLQSLGLGTVGDIRLAEHKGP